MLVYEYFVAQLHILESICVLGDQAQKKEMPEWSTQSHGYPRAARVLFVLVPIYAKSEVCPSSPKRTANDSKFICVLFGRT